MGIISMTFLFVNFISQEKHLIPKHKNKNPSEEEFSSPFI